MVRHGNTTYDDKVDGTLNPPLDEDGVNRIKRTVAFIDRSKIRPSRIVSSPLQRCLMVAEMISRGNIKVTTNNACLPWNLGDIEGKTNKLANITIEHLMDYPDLKAPHGESYRTFYLRWSEFLERLMEYVESTGQDVLVTTHSRNINALQEIIGGNPIGDVEQLTPEASVTLLANNGVSWNYHIIWDGK